MWTGRHCSPKQLGAIAVGGVLLCVVTTVVAEFRAWSTHQQFFAGLDIGRGGWVLRFCLGILIFFPGLVIAQVAMSRLREGVRLEWWSEQEIDALRAHADRPIWTVLGWVLIAAYFVLIVFSRSHQLTTIAVFYFLLPFNTVTSLRIAVRKSSARDARRIDWSKMKPLVSDHWGQKAG